MTGGGTQRLRWCAGVGAAGLLALIGAAPGAPVAIEGFRVTRPVDVERPGPVKLSLAYDDVRELLPAATDLHVFSPEGRELPFRITFESVEERREPIRLVAVERHEAGWRVRLDAGSDPAPHRALLFEMNQSALAPGVRLESSREGDSWRQLTKSDLFRVGDELEMRRATLAYEPTTDRHLRLDWPQQAGFPEAEKIVLERSPARPVEQRVEVLAASPDEDAGYRLRGEAPLARRLSLEILGEGTVGFRLRRAHDGAWQPVTTGVWHLGSGHTDPSATSVRVVPLPDIEQPPELRLELYGDARRPPQLTAYTFEYPSQTVFFRAPRTGRYTLAYGGDHRRSTGTLQINPAEQRLADWVEPGPAERHPPPPLAGPAVTDTTPLPAAAFSGSWEVLAPSAHGGSVVRLALPSEALHLSREDLADLRLAVRDRQLPYLLWWPDAPVISINGLRQSPQPGSDRDTSMLALKLPGARLLQVDLTTFEGPFQRRVRARFAVDPRRPFGAPTPQGSWRTWRCTQRDEVPCLLSFQLRASGGVGELEIEFDDGNNPPLGELRLDLWRSAPQLLFIWPERETVRLLAGDRELGAPAYDFQLLRERVLRRSWIEAHLDLQAAAELHTASQKRNRLVLLVVLAVAALFLLVLLARTLNSSPDRPTST
jgi:hypothetical protein